MNKQRLSLTNGPLVAVLIQAKFSTIVQIAKYIPTVQDELRRKSYPLYDELYGSPPPYMENEKGQFIQWVFSSNDYSRNIIIDNEGITYQVFDCNAFEYKKFIDEFIGLLQRFDNIVDISSLTRLGLRYVNAIPEKTECSWKDLLNSSLQGTELPEKIAWHDNPLFAFSTQRGVSLESLKMSSNFHLNIYQNPHGSMQPQGVIKFPLGETGFFEGRPLVTFIDLDHYILFKAAEKGALFSRLEIIFDALHSVIKEVFFSTLITEKAKEIWQ